jgi:hypothetical protein
MARGEHLLFWVEIMWGGARTWRLLSSLFYLVLVYLSTGLCLRPYSPFFFGASVVMVDNMLRSEGGEHFSMRCTIETQ